MNLSGEILTLPQQREKGYTIMKRITDLIVLAAIAAGMAACGKTTNTDMDKKTNPTLETIALRRSVRHYTERAVPQDTVELLLRAAMAAPSSKDRRPWHFIVVNDRSTLDTLSTRLPFASMLARVPQALVVCGDSGLSESWYLDCSAATQNFLLAAQAMGLAAVWTGVYPNADRIVTVQEELALPPTIMPLAVVPFGYTNGTEQPKDKFDALRIHHNKW